MRTLGLTILAVSCTLATAPRVAADWIETSIASGSHNLPGTAEVITGGGPLLNIFGSIASGTDFDVYRLVINSPGTFSASTVGTPGTVGDTQLFLFTTAGMGIAANDDSPTSFRSLLPAGSALYSSLLPGEYLLAVSGFNRDPASVGGAIFPDSFTGVFGPTGPGGGSPFTTHNGSSGVVGTYTIALTGAEAVRAVPEPASVILLGIGAATALGYRRLRKPDAV